MGVLKLMTVVGTRPEIIRLSEVIKECDRRFDHFLVHTEQNWDYELSQVFFEDLGLRAPDKRLGVAGESLGETIGNVVARSYECIARVRPDALLVLGDTNSCLAALSAKRLHVPVFHMEAGNRCFDERLPEEVNRRVVDHVADVNLCYSEHARRNLVAEGRPRERTFVTGSPMAEVLSANWARIEASDALSRLGLEERGYLLLSAHREETVDDERCFRSLMGAAGRLAERYGRPVLYSMHPRSKKRAAALGISLHPLVRPHAPLSFSDYNRLQMGAFCVVSDSGTLPEEAAYFAARGRTFPAVSARSSTERPEALEAGVFIMGSTSPERLEQAVELAADMVASGRSPSRVFDYADESVSSKVVRIIQSYAAVVDDVVWRKI